MLLKATIIVVFISWKAPQINSFVYWSHIVGDIGFDDIALPEAAQSELGLYARSVREPNQADASRLSPSSSTSSGNDAIEVKDGGVLPMDVDVDVDAAETAKTKSPERSRLLLSTTVLDNGPDDADDVYNYGMLADVSQLPPFPSVLDFLFFC